MMKNIYKNTQKYVKQSEKIRKQINNLNHILNKKVNTDIQKEQHY